MDVVIWVAVDESGDVVVTTDEVELEERTTDELAPPIRVVKVTVTVPLPVMLELTGEVPAEPNATKLKLA